MSLTNKQATFCFEYSKDMNGAAACIRAGYSEASARQQASRLLTNANVKAKIAQMLAESAANVNITLTDVINELKVIMLADISQYASWDGCKVTMKASSELSADTMKAIESVSTTSSKTGEPQLRVKLHSKLKSAELLIRIFELQEVEARLAIIEKQLGLLE